MLMYPAHSVCRWKQRHTECAGYIVHFTIELPAMNPPDDTLAAALGRHAIELPEPKIAKLEQYCTLLWDWNSKLNLTRHTDYEKFVARDVVDTLAFSKFLEPGETVLDVGTGGGVPGLLLAMLREDLDVSLCESVGKKARAVADIAQQLGLATLVYNVRAETLLADHQFTTLLVRAVAPLRKLLEWFKPHWLAFDRLLVLKGPAWVAERAEARHLGLMRNLAL